MGYVEFALSDDAQICMQKSKGFIKIQKEDGSKAKIQLKMVPDKQENKKDLSKELGLNEKPDFKKMREDSKLAKIKKARLIVRNLSFQASENELKCHFETVGKVQDVHILKRPDGRRVGCAFVQMDDVKTAAKAIKVKNGSQLKGRTVAVDWAVGKKEYQQDNPAPTRKVEDVEIKEEEEEEEEVTIKKEEEESDQDQDDDEDDEDDMEEDDDEEDDDEDMDEDDEDDEDGKDKKWHNLKTGHDVNEGLTVFVRNLSFDSEEEDLLNMCRDRFGAVWFARLVVDRNTGHPKGTAFVKFKEAESAAAMLKASEMKKGDEGEAEEGLWLDERRIYACM